MSLHEEKREVLCSIRRMREWVVEAEHIFAGSWAKLPEEITNQAVGQRFDDYVQHLGRVLETEERSDLETACLKELLRVFVSLRPRLTQCYDLEGFPRTNNDLERTIRALKMRYRRISGRKNWKSYLLRYGRCVAYHEWWMHQPDGEARLEARLRSVPASSWHLARQQTRQSQEGQLHRFQFRHRPVEYLASLEERWEQTTRTGVLPP